MKLSQIFKKWLSNSVSIKERNITRANKIKKDIDKRINANYIQIKEYLLLLFVLAGFNGFHMWIYLTLEQRGVFEYRTSIGVVLLMFFVLLMAAIVTLTIGLVRHRTMTHPLQKLSEAAKKIAKGNLSVRITPMRKDGKKDYVEVLFDDFNAMTEELLNAKNKLEEAAEAKSKFFTNMSHEIRTPMNAILGITEIEMEDETLPQKTKTALGRIYNSGDMLLEIINNILDMSKIEAGKMELVNTEYEFASLINDAVQINLIRFENKPIKFKLIIDENIPSMLKGDELKIKQIINNILSNAAKYTKSGEVIFTVKTETTNEKIMLILRVQDTGQGMTQEQVSKIFDVYERFNMDINRSIQGTGLGMSITQKLICLMNGEISVKSEPGIGSDITVYLPQDNTGAKPLGKEHAEQLQKLNFHSLSKRKSQIMREPMPYGSVLIVDDTEANLYVAKGLLTPYKLNIYTTESGIEAIEIIKSGRQFDIIFMDHMMPKMDGIEATKIIRSIGYTSPIVALTANAVAGQSEIFLSNGFDDFISKPIDTRQLNDVLNKLIRDKQTPEVIEAARSQYNNLQKDNTEVTLKNYDQLFNELTLIENLDINAGLDYIGQNIEGYLDVLRYFTEKSGSYIEELENAITDKNMENYTIRSHTLKGVLGNLGAQKLSQIAAFLEKADESIRIKETEAFCSKIRHFADKLRNTSLLETLADKNKNKKQITDTQFLKEQIVKLQNACINYSFGDTKQIFSTLSEYDLDKETETKLKNIYNFLDSFDYDKALEEIGTLLRRLT